MILLLAQAWKAFAGLAISAAGQLALTTIYFGTAVMRAYFDTMLHMSRWVGLSEVGPAHIQMHSLRSFFTLLMPWPDVSLALYLVSSIAAIAIAASVWKSTATLAVRFSALILVSVLVNPHLFIYDLLVLAPVFLLLVDWMLRAQALGRAGAACAFVSLLHAAFVGPALSMDTPPTLRRRLCRVIVGPVGHFQNSQICLEPTRRCITLLPIWALCESKES